MMGALTLAAAATCFTRNEATELGDGGGDSTKITVFPPEANMEDIEIRVNGVAGIKYKQPKDIETYDLLAKRSGAALAAANKQQLFHGSYGDIRAAVTAKLVDAGYRKPKLFIGKTEVVEIFEGEGKDRKLKGYENVSGSHKEFKVDADVKVEPDKAYFDNICAENDLEPASFKDLIQEAANENGFDPSRKERTSGPRKIAKTYLAAAEQIIAAGDEAVLAVAAQLEENLERTIDVSDPETRLQVLAAAISDSEAKERREREAQTANKYLSMAGK